jgi:hypothetical protein
MALASTARALLETYRANRETYEGTVHSLLLNTLIRHAPGPIYVSTAAQAEASRRGIPGDLRDYHWDNRRRVMGADWKETFAWDHFYPVAELRRSLDKLEAPTVEEVRLILKRASVAWILRREDRRLNELGFRHRRPDPGAAYLAAGIRLLHGPGT